MFFDDYSKLFPRTPVFLGEFAGLYAGLKEDLDTMMSLAAANPLFLGTTFFEYQVSYWKFGPEREFGMFGLGGTTLATMEYLDKSCDVYCLVPVDRQEGGVSVSVSEVVAQAFGGFVPNASTFCEKKTLGVPLDESGYREVLMQRDVAQMAIFVERVVNHMGATIVPQGYVPLRNFAKSIVDDAAEGGLSLSLRHLISHFHPRPEWIEFDSTAACVADRSAPPHVIENAVQRACTFAKAPICERIPLECASNSYTRADFVFNSFYHELGFDNPLVSCDFSGAAIFASSRLYDQWTGSAQCAAAVSTINATNASRETSMSNSSLRGARL